MIRPVLCTVVMLLAGLPVTASAKPADGPQTHHDDHGEAPVIEQGTSADGCVAGVSGGYPCRHIELLSRVPLADMGGTSGNDSWGWRDPQTGRLIALMGMDNGVGFVDVTELTAPVVLGRLPSTIGSSSWRDVKVFADHAFVVADSINDHGMQVFDLARLRGVTEPQVFDADALYTGIGRAHNVAIDEDSGYAFVVGSDTCSGGLHMVDISTPQVPVNAGCFSADGYTHDVYCTTYHGPDPQFNERQICFASNTDSLTIVDVTDKGKPLMVGKTAYPGVGYSHQGWLSADQRYFLMGDELDERNAGNNARTLVFDVSDLSAPVYAGAHLGGNGTIDHNLYTVGNFVFQANYSAGLRILLAEDLSRASMREIAYFDTVPAVDQRAFTGAWNVYPFFGDGLILISDMQAGLFVVRASLPVAENAPINGRLTGAWTAPGLNDQGLSLFVGENSNGPFVYFAWFLFRDGQPFWLAGDTAFAYGADEVEIPTEALSGLDFLEVSGAQADRQPVGTLQLHAHGCNHLHLTYDFGDGLGSGEVEMDRLLNVQGRECPPDN